MFQVIMWVSISKLGFCKNKILLHMYSNYVKYWGFMNTVCLERDWPKIKSPRKRSTVPDSGRSQDYKTGFSEILEPRPGKL